MTDPELLLLDEPAAGLDLGGREDLVSTLSVLAMDETSPATVLVSHHVEEIPPGFTHALLLREGRVVAAGPLEQVLTEEMVSATFGMPMRLTREDDRWAARRRSPLMRTSWVGSEHGLAAGPLWEIWLGLAIVLGVAELFSLDLILLMLAVGAVVGIVDRADRSARGRPGRWPRWPARWRCWRWCDPASSSGCTPARPGAGPREAGRPQGVVVDGDLQRGRPDPDRRRGVDGPSLRRGRGHRARSARWTSSRSGAPPPWCTRSPSSSS